MKNKRILSLLIAVIMALSVVAAMTIGVFAEDDEKETQKEGVTVQYWYSDSFTWQEGESFVWQEGESYVWYEGTGEDGEKKYWYAVGYAWGCTCGQVNSEETCSACGASRPANILGNSFVVETAEAPDSSMVEKISGNLGCSGVLSMGGMVVATVLSACCLVKRRKDD